MLTIQGAGVSSGVAIGPLRFFKRNSQAVARRRCAQRPLIASPPAWVVFTIRTIPRFCA